MYIFAYLIEKLSKQKNVVSVLLVFRHAEFKTDIHLRFLQNTKLLAAQAVREMENWKNTFSVFLVSIAPLYRKKKKKIWVIDSIYKQDDRFYLNDVFWCLLLGIFSLYFIKPSNTPLCYIITIPNVLIDLFFYFFLCRNALYLHLTEG